MNIISTDKKWMCPIQFHFFSDFLVPYQWRILKQNWKAMMTSISSFRRPFQIGNASDKCSHILVGLRILYRFSLLSVNLHAPVSVVRTKLTHAVTKRPQFVRLTALLIYCRTNCWHTLTRMDLLALSMFETNHCTQGNLVGTLLTDKAIEDCVLTDLVEYIKKSRYIPISASLTNHAAHSLLTRVTRKLNIVYKSSLTTELYPGPVQTRSRPHNFGPLLQDPSILVPYFHFLMSLSSDSFPVDFLKKYCMQWKFNPTNYNLNLL
jgi:hypothetical protein